MFQPIRTERLLIRPVGLEDAEGLWERRNDPEVAVFQNWATPYPMEKAQQLMSELVAMDGPENGEWWMAAIADAETEEVLGDLALHMSDGGHFAEIGYTLFPQHWRKGYAVEASAGLVEYLFETLGVVRVFGMLHPGNPASARVLERVGMLFEGHTRSSFVLEGEVSDDWIYGMIRSDWEKWRDRPRHPVEAVALVEVTDRNFEDVYRLRTHKTQERFVAPMPRSLSQALVAPASEEEPETAWYRAIEADGLVAGFVMVAFPLAGDPEPILWRLLIDRLQQRRGIASKALDLVEAEMRARGHSSWRTSWVPGRGGPETFYLARGFEPTGDFEGGEVKARQGL